MSPSLAINIGWARAGSTAFRSNFIARHPEISAVGRDQPLAEGPGAVLLQHLKDASDAEFERYLPELAAERDEYVRGRGQRVVCVTDEELSIGIPGGASPATIARRCSGLFPGARTFAIVRDHADAVRSFYTLAVQSGRAGGLPYAAWARRFFLNPEPGCDFAYLFAYMRTLRAYLAWQSRADVLVLQFDRVWSDPARAYEHVASWLGVSPAICARLPRAVVNASPRAQVEQVEREGTSAAETDRAIRSLYASDRRELQSVFGIDFTVAEAPHAR